VPLGQGTSFFDAISGIVLHAIPPQARFVFWLAKKSYFMKFVILMIKKKGYGTKRSFHLHVIA
jgi:hypothetical protein